jgi:hypothetical protein
MVARYAWHADVESADQPLVDQALDEARRLLETGLNARDIELLEEAAHDPNHRLPDDARSIDLLAYGKLIPFPNKSEWYYPHPLLTMNLVQPWKPGSNT